YGPASPLVDEVKAAVEGCGAEFRPDGYGNASLFLGRGAPRNPVSELVKRHGLWGLSSAEKFVPDEIFALPDEQIARFLSVLYACDGHVSVSTRLANIGYTTISERLARDVQHLL